MAQYFVSEWDQYVRRVLPKHVSPVQLLETRRAFYAGGMALLSMMMSNLGSGEEPTDADLLMMDIVHEEFAQFNRDVLAGKA